MFSPVSVPVLASTSLLPVGRLCLVRGRVQLPSSQTEVLLLRLLKTLSFLPGTGLTARSRIKGKLECGPISGLCPVPLLCLSDPYKSILSG